MKFDFDKVTDRSGSFAAKYELAAKRNKPLDAISLWIADMDFPTAPCIQQELNGLVERGIFGYARQTDRYYNAVKKWFKERHDFDFTEEEIVNTPGVCFAISSAVKACTQPGDKVLIQRPVYYPISNILNLLDRKIVNSPLVYKNGRYEIDFEDFENKIKTEVPKLFILCSPHNPGGRVWTKDELSRLSEICLKYNVTVVSDEIHADITFGGHKHTVYSTLSEQAAQNSIVCTAPSKTFNLAGLQFSNVIIKNKIIRDRFIREYDRTGYDEPSLMGLAAATAAYENGGEWFDAVKEYIQSNIQFTKDYIAKNCPRIKVCEPEGTYLVWLDFSDYAELTDVEISKRVLYNAKVWLDYGTMFGKEGEKFQRINVATPRSILEEALKRICREFSGE